MFLQCRRRLLNRRSKRYFVVVPIVGATISNDARRYWTDHRREPLTVLRGSCKCCVLLEVDARYTRLEHIDVHSFNGSAKTAGQLCNRALAQSRETIFRIRRRKTCRIAETLLLAQNSYPCISGCGTALSQTLILRGVLKLDDSRKTSALLFGTSSHSSSLKSTLAT